MSQTNQQKSFQQVASVIAKAKADIREILSDPQHGHVLIGTDTALDNLVNRFNFLGGVIPQADQTNKEQFPPVTNFMGDDIHRAKEVTKADITPGEEEKQKYLARVEKLYSEFDTLAPEGILNSHTTPEDVAVLRGVAKRAGVEGYEDKELTIPFLEKISAAIKQKAADEAEQKRIDAELDKEINVKRLTENLTAANERVEDLEGDLEEANEELSKAAGNKKAEGIVQKKIDALNKDLQAAQEEVTKITNDLTALQPE